MEEQFIKYCREGNIVNLIDYYHDSNFSHEYFDEGFEEACKNGHINVVYFLSIFDRSTKLEIEPKLKINYDSGFSCAAYYSHLDILKYLYDEKKLVDVNNHASLFSLAINNKNLDYVKWVLSVKKENVKEYINDVCYYGNLEILKYFNELEPTLFDDEKIKKEALNNAELVKNTEIINWIKENYFT